MPPARDAGTPPHGRGPAPVRSRPAGEELAGRFFDAFRDGDVDGLRALLAAAAPSLSGAAISVIVRRRAAQPVQTRPVSQAGPRPTPH